MFAKHLDDAELFTCAGVQFGMFYQEKLRDQ